MWNVKKVDLIEVDSGMVDIRGQGGWGEVRKRLINEY
jgi:hypothetical protein